MYRKERVEDLGRLFVMIEDILDDDFFTYQKIQRPKDAWDNFVELDEDQKEDYITQLTYGISRIQDKLIECFVISKGEEE